MKRIILALTLLIAGVVIYRYLLSETRIVTKRLKSLIAVLEKDGSENTVEAALKAREAGDFFHLDALVFLNGSLSIRGRDQVVRNVVYFRNFRNKIKINLGYIDAESLNGAVITKFRVRVTGDKTDRGKFLVSAKWVKEDGGWVIAEARIVEEE